MNKKKILFLYTELAGYFLACVKTLKENYPADIHIVHFPVNSEAPFEFKNDPEIKFYNRSKLNNSKLQEEISKIKPDLVFVSGWIDKGYLKVIRNYDRKIPKIIAIDNQWQDSLKQKAGVKLLKYLITRHFTHCWIPGLNQYEFVRKMGFDQKQILTGLYSADVGHFIIEEQSFTKRFLFLGRLISEKGADELYKAFKSIVENSDWELWLIGNGNLKEEIKGHERIKVLDFIQPDKLPEILSHKGVFVLPAKFEPWGVAVHEAAAAGCPLICSNAVGSASAFLRSGYNGFQIEAGNLSQLKEVLIKIMDTDEKELLKMGQRSRELSKQITPGTWAATLWQIIANT